MQVSNERLSLLRELAALEPPTDINNASLDAYARARDDVITRLQTLLKEKDKTSLRPEEFAALETAMHNGRILEERVADFRARLHRSLAALNAARQSEQAYTSQSGQLVRTLG